MQGIFLVELGSDPRWLHFALARTDLGGVSGMNLQSSLVISYSRYRKPRNFSDEHVNLSVLQTGASQYEDFLPALIDFSFQSMWGWRTI